MPSSFERCFIWWSPTQPVPMNATLNDLLTPCAPLRNGLPRDGGTWYGARESLSLDEKAQGASSLGVRSHARVAQGEALCVYFTFDARMRFCTGTSLSSQRTGLIASFAR